MSGSQGVNTTEGGNQFAEIVLTGRIGSALTDILMAEAIVPGSAPSYELCKLIYAYHPLGAKMAEAPLNMAQSQDREITIPVAGEELLADAFNREWKSIGSGVGASSLIKSLKTQSRIYGIASIVMGDRNKPGGTNEPVDWDKLPDIQPYFTVMDPLNTAGSLILNQDPNSPDYQKPTSIRVGGRTYHPSRSCVVMNESPLFIQWSNAAFGFSGRSVYQRALFPMKTFLQTLITDDMVTKKVGLLIWKAQAPGSIMNNRILSFFSQKRSQLKGGMTGNVLTIPITDDIESLNLQNLEGPAAMARSNALENTAMAASMPAKMLAQEELVAGFGEGTEDAKQIARFIDRLRIEMAPEYSWFDRIVQCRAWTPAFYETIQAQIPDYKKIPFKTAFYSWVNAFGAVWPNLLAEPESKEIEVEKTRFESVVALLETLPQLVQSPKNKASIADWAANEINVRRKLFSSPLEIDLDEEERYAKKVKETMPPPGADGEQEPTPRAFSSET